MEEIPLPAEVAEEIARRASRTFTFAHAEALMSGFPNMEADADAIAGEAAESNRKYLERYFRENGRLP